MALQFDPPDRDSELDLDRSLEESLLTTWNARVVDYDCQRFPFHEWILGRIRAMGHPVDELTRLHEVIDTREVYRVSKQLCADTNLPEFRELLMDFVRDEIVPKGRLETPVAVQRFLNVRIMLPNKPQSIFPFHTGVLYGHGPASRSLWMPLTDVRADEDASASMQILDIGRSRELIRYATENFLSVDEMTELFAKESWTLKCGPGLVTLFNQENIHGNFVNETNKTRVSIDFRIAEARYGDRLARKIPGGYFEIISETKEAQLSPARFSAKTRVDNTRSNILYLNNATPSTDGVPVHLQRYMVYEYCEKHGLTYEFELFELEEMKHLPTLRHLVEVLKCNGVLYSVFALPPDREFRNKILDTALGNGCILHFVNEDMCITDPSDKEQVERLLDFAKYSDD